MDSLLQCQPNHFVASRTTRHTSRDCGILSCRRGYEAKGGDGYKDGPRERSRYIAKQKTDGVTHDLLLWLPNSYGRSFLPTPSWIGSLFLRVRPVYATAAITRAAAVTLPKITSVVIGFPFPSFPCPECQFPPCGSGNPLLKTIPVSREKSDLLEFAFGPEPIVNLIAWEVATLKIDFICAAPDFFVTWRADYRSIFCLRLNGACMNLQSLISLAFQCHTRVPFFRN